MADSLGEESIVIGLPDTTTGQDGVMVNEQRQIKRRKVRKGTRSCWECKRRKIRCIFSSTDGVTCLNCQQRRAPCISQDLPEDLSPARIGNRHLGMRISKVEDFMKEILAHKDGDVASHFEEQPRQETRPRLAGADGSPIWVNTPVQTNFSRSTGYRKIAAVPSILTPDSQGIPSSVDTDPALNHLLAAFPTDEDARILARQSSRTVIYNETIHTQPHSKLTSEIFATLSSDFKLPGLHPHPVILARCMLIFAITLQSPARDKYFQLSEPQDVIMHRLVQAATTWVTTKEEMQESVEGLICIILEGIFEINCGNLRRAWAVYRRAMTAAQLMGLHRSSRPLLRYLDSKTDAHPEILWFRIIYMDRYLSLLLGLPQGTSETNMPPSLVRRDEPPLGKFEYLLTIIAFRILERNEHAFDSKDLETTQSIDLELLELSKSMPASFWRPVSFHGLTLGEPATYLETLRLGAQVYYYGLLIHLHLPYMMQIDDKRRIEYAKNACVNASREILTRFITHRSFNPASTCSRPVDFFALLAAMTLLLAHLDSQYHRKATNFLAHQRSSDRAMLDQVLGTMSVISDFNEDKVTEKSAIVVKRLLEIEEDASEGSDYITKAVGREANAKQGEKIAHELCIDIPYLGTVKISRQGSISRKPPQSNGVPILDRGSVSAQLPVSHSAEVSSDPTVLETIMPTEYLIAPLQTPRNEEAVSDYPSPGQDITVQAIDAIDPPAADINDWAFQGVDVAFFDNLMRGTSCLDVDLEQQCTEDPYEHVL